VVGLTDLLPSPHLTLSIVTSKCPWSLQGGHNRDQLVIEGSTSATGTVGTTLLFLLVGTWVYSAFCALMVIRHRRGTKAKWFAPIWSSNGLSEIGRHYRRRHIVSVVVGSVIALIWFMFVEPL
jgi:hypothetical protein